MSVRLSYSKSMKRKDGKEKGTFTSSTTLKVDSKGTKTLKRESKYVPNNKKNK